MRDWLVKMYATECLSINKLVSNKSELLLLLYYITLHLCALMHECVRMQSRDLLLRSALESSKTQTFT